MKKEKVFIGIPSFSNHVNLSLLQMAWELPFVSADPSTKYEFHLHADGGQRPQDLCRNRITGAFLKSNCDVLLMIDDDMIQKGWRTMRLLDTPDYDICAPIQLMFHPINVEAGRDKAAIYPCAFTQSEEQAKANQMSPVYPTGELECTEVDAVGSGCIAIRRHVLENEKMLLAPGYDPPAMWASQYEPNWVRYQGLDINFCLRAKALGYTIKVNWNAEIGHNKDVDLNEVEAYAKSQFTQGYEEGRRDLRLDNEKNGARPGNGAMAQPGGRDNEAVAQVGLDRAQAGEVQADAQAQGG